MSFSDFKEVSINNPGTASFYGSDDLNEIMRIFNAKVVSNRQVKIKNPWQFQDNYDVVAASVVPANPGANTKRFYVDPADNHFKMKSTGGSILDFDVLGAGAQGEANLASNIGGGGQGFFKQKTGVNLEFRNLNVASNKLSVALDATNNEVDIDLVESNVTLQNLTGILTVSRGGTGINTLAVNSLLKGNGTSPLVGIAPGTDGHVLTMQSGAPTWAAASAAQDVKTAIFEGGTQVGSVGRRLNFSILQDFAIGEDAGNDRFNIQLNRREVMAANWISPGSIAFNNVGITYQDVFTSNGDGVGTDIDTFAATVFRFYVSWNKNGGLSTHGCRIVDQTGANVLAEITNCVNGKNVVTGSIPAFFLDQVRSVKIQMKAGNTTDDPMFRGASLYFK